MKEQIAIHVSTGKIAMCILMFVLGQALHLFWIKIPALRERAKLANKSFSMKEYFCYDWNVIAGMQIVGIVCIIGLGSALKLRPALTEYVEWVFFFIAFSGSAAVLAKLSKFDGVVKTAMGINSEIAASVPKDGAVG